MTTASWILVGMVFGGILLSVAISFLVKELPHHRVKRCPLCGRGGQIESWRQMPGTLRKRWNLADDQGDPHRDADIAGTAGRKKKRRESMDPMPETWPDRLCLALPPGQTPGLFGRSRGAASRFPTAA
jgi:hypothetical protein